MMFANKGKKWTQEEQDLLVSRYRDQELGILEVAKLHQRTVEGVISRLKSEGLVSKFARSEDYPDNVNGYSDYVKDEEYKQAEAADKEARAAKSAAKTAHVRLLPVSIMGKEDSSVEALQKELADLKMEVRTLKDQVTTMAVKMLSMK